MLLKRMQRSNMHEGRIRVSSVSKALTALFLAFLLSASSAFAGCSSAAIDGAKQALESDMQLLQEHDGAYASELFGSIWFYPEDYGVSSSCFSEIYFRDFEYALGEAKESGDAVTVDLTVSAYGIDGVLETLAHARDEALATGADANAEGYADVAFASASEAASWEREQLTLKVDMVKGLDGAWSVVDEATLAAVLLDGHDPRQTMS